MDETLFFEEDYILHPLLGISLGIVCLWNVSSPNLVVVEALTDLPMGTSRSLTHGLLVLTS